MSGQQGGGGGLSQLHLNHTSYLSDRQARQNLQVTLATVWAKESDPLN